jgi:hypothetical protein
LWDHKKQILLMQNLQILDQYFSHLTSIKQEVDLVEVSLVTFPANPKALIGSVKSGSGPGIRDAEKALREVGFSANEAKAVLAKGFSAIERREGADGMTDQERQNEAVANAIAALRAR